MALNDVNWGAFIAASLAVNFYPGPNNLFAIANGARHGILTAAWASLGRQVAFAALISLLSAGLGFLLIASPLAFRAFRWSGAIFLLWLGVRMLLTSPRRAVTRADRGQLMLQEFAVAFANPKPVLVLLPFLPSLVVPGEITSGAVLVAGFVFLALEGAAALAYAFAGRSLGSLTQSERGMAWLNRVGGLAVIASAVLLLAV